jgi:hypothetical protein
LDLLPGDLECVVCCYVDGQLKEALSGLVVDFPQGWWGQDRAAAFRVLRAGDQMTMV